MAYTQILKSLHRNLQQCKLTHVRLLIHTQRTASTVSRLSFLRRAEAPSSAVPVLSCFIQSQTQTRRGVWLDSAVRNQSKPEDRDRSVSRYQSGSPKPSATQKDISLNVDRNRRRKKTARDKDNKAGQTKVKEAGRDFTYLIVVLIGLGVTGGLLYVVFQELFSSSSPNKVYGKAFNILRLDPEVIGAFGEPIKCYGETTRRGRRQQVSHHEYLKDGLKHMRLKFYIEGSEPGLKGTVHSESKENPETGKYEFRYIFVEVDTYPRRTIIVEDNR